MTYTSAVTSKLQILPLALCFVKNHFLMKELSLKEVQEYSFKVLLKVHDFCVEHDIPYTLAYGTLIGAVRHKGFIPWDDDVDIIMTRENFDRFVREYQSNDNFLLVSPEDKNSFIAFARVCEMKETVIETTSPWYNYQTGIWIDIFPMDSVSDNEQEHKKRYSRLNRLWNHLVSLRMVKESWAPHYYWKYGLKKLIYLNAVHLTLVKRFFISLIKSPKYSQSKHCAQLACCDEYGYFEKKDFEQYTTLEFEGHQFMVIKDYDKVLRILYGDYMQLPPVEDQVPRQQNYIKFYHR